jgi:hypothetical protein
MWSGGSGDGEEDVDLAGVDLLLQGVVEVVRWWPRALQAEIRCVLAARKRRAGVDLLLLGRVRTAGVDGEGRRGSRGEIWARIER